MVDMDTAIRNIIATDDENEEIQEKRLKNNKKKNKEFISKFYKNYE